MKVLDWSWAVLSVTSLAVAGPAPQALGGLVGALLENVQVILQGIFTGIDGALDAGRFQDIRDNLRRVDPLAQPRAASVEEAFQRLQGIQETNPSNLYNYIANLRALNLVDTIDSLEQYADGFLDGENGSNNNNPDPGASIYPQKFGCDVPYTVPESSLRGAIYIPPGFTYGEKSPVILFPGTGATGYTTFQGNFIPLLQGSDFADPVWVNVPGLLLDDAQTNAEYAAYAISYISTLTDGDVTIVGWSQGNINIHWALKYFPSTRLVTKDHVAVSADYAGTIMANFIGPPGVPLPPAVLQQRYLESSDFITALRANGGESAFVPTTNIYSSSFDEIVEPQQGTGASAFLAGNAERGADASNYDVQVVCPAQPAGSFYTHEGVLYNPLAFALFRDAMSHDGPGSIDRLDLAAVCSQYLTPGLDLGDLLVTENAIAIAGLSILAYEAKTASEPVIVSYARRAPINQIERGTCTVRQARPEQQQERGGSATTHANSTTVTSNSPSTRWS